MATKTDIKKIVENRLISTDTDLEKLKAGSDEHSKAVKDISLLAGAYAEIEKVRIQQEDNEARREEQKRMNDAELEFKETQLAIDAARAENDKIVKTKQLKNDILKICMDGAINGLAWIGYSSVARRAYRAEYIMSDGASSQLPNNVRKPIELLMPKKRF